MSTVVRFNGVPAGDVPVGNTLAARPMPLRPEFRTVPGGSAFQSADVFFGQGEKPRKSRRLLWLLPLLALLPMQDGSRFNNGPSALRSQGTVAMQTQATNNRDLFVRQTPDIRDCGCEDDGVRPAAVPEHLTGLAALSAEQRALADYLRPRVARIVVRSEEPPAVLPPLEDFFPFLPRGARPPAPPPEPEKKAALGTGWICQSDGIIVTNHHVIDGALTGRNGKIEVIIGNRTYDAKVIAVDEPADLAFLKIETDEPLPTLHLADEPATQGEVIALMGQPKGLDQILTIGTVSGTHQSAGGLGLPAFTTDAAVNGGNSGGPGVRPDGGVLGVVVAKYSGFDVDNIGFVIQSRYVSGALRRIDEGKSLERMSLGAMISTPDAVRRFSPDEESDPASAQGFLEAQRRLQAHPVDGFGAVVVRIVPESLAARSGQLQVGDIITAVNGEPFDSTTQMVGDIKNIFADEPVTLTLLRAGKRFTATLNEN